MGGPLKQIYDMNDRKVISAHSNEQKIVQMNKKKSSNEQKNSWLYGLG